MSAICKSHKISKTSFEIRSTSIILATISNLLESKQPQLHLNLSTMFHNIHNYRKTVTTKFKTLTTPIQKKKGIWPTQMQIPLKEGEKNFIGVIIDGVVKGQEVDPLGRVDVLEEFVFHEVPLKSLPINFRGELGVRGAISDWGCSRFLDLSEFQVILGMPWRTREEEERAPLFGFFAGEEWICLLDLRLGLLRDWADGAREVKPWSLCWKDERSSQAQVTWQRVKREAGIRRGLVVVSEKLGKLENLGFVAGFVIVLAFGEHRFCLIFCGESRGIVSRRSLEDHFEVVFHHGGHLINDGPLKYEGESTTLSFDPDRGGSVLDDRLEPLSDDRGAMHMMNLARLNGQVHLFVVHTVSEAEIVHLLENVPHNIGEEEVQPVMHDSDDGECEQVHDECQEVGDGECEVPVSEERAEGDDVVEGQIEDECDKVKLKLNVIWVSLRDDVVEGEIEVECDVGESEGDHVDVRSWSSSGEDANVDCNVDVPSMDDLVDCDIQEAVGHGVGNWFGEVEVDVQDDGPSWTHISDSDVDVGINTDNDREELLSGGESDGEDDEEESYGKFVTFSMPKTMVDYKWDLGTYFANKQDILDAIKTYAVENGRNLTYVKNDKKRIRVKCMGAKGNYP
ncbi:hypothetical protein V8G54_021630 [Vigna mungo]|uniref:Transposase MuDR plant domain-containing protein n=1 Tax=Vigna mungo TaxID=3915 RepID=A0AAQ3RXJ0_VIGMU